MTVPSVTICDCLLQSFTICYRRLPSITIHYNLSIGGNTDGLRTVATPPPARGGAGGRRFPTSADWGDARRSLRPWSGSQPSSRQGRLSTMTRREGGSRPGGRCQGWAGREEDEMRNSTEQILQWLSSANLVVATLEVHDVERESYYGNQHSWFAAKNNLKKMPCIGTQR